MLVAPQVGDDMRMTEDMEQETRLADWQIMRDIG